MLGGVNVSVVNGRVLRAYCLKRIRDLQIFTTALLRCIVVIQSCQISVQASL